ncbi:9419_t:CDS:2 [Funneliformis mosseae]|uniref:9419_t:CDS:1 n=1 Tax=Funneliformis mosseae TaxID=27381 RepID=A0A9N9DXL3_FUNMO|nr:9419_t:CDS:2 [Funneliformis mosseae]
MTLFDDESDFLIRYYMGIYEKCPDRFVKISEIMPKYNPRQISARWRDYLDPNLCNDPFTEDEKRYIIEQTPNHRKSDNICWRDLSSDLEKRFGRFHSYNKIKSYWNVYQKRQKKNSFERTVPLLLNGENGEKKYRKESRSSINTDGRIPVSFLLQE